MSRMRLLLGIMSICLLGLQMRLTEVRAEEASILYIGIEKKRMPYAYFDENQRPAGVIVAILNNICFTSGLNCQFVGGQFAENLQSVRNIKLNAVVVLDQSLPPGVDALNLTHPPDTSSLKLSKQLCRISSLFIQKKSAPPRSKPEDFKDTIIGVQEGSVYHKYLVDSYSGLAQLKPYPLLESAIMDLVFDRVDAVLGDAVTLNSRVFNTQLDEYAGIVATGIDIPDLPNTTMTLALRERDMLSVQNEQGKDRFARLSQALKDVNNDRTCMQLLLDADKSTNRKH